MLRIDSLEITDFMCCNHVKMDFEGSNTIVFEGDNGNGKSAVLDAIAVCLSEFKKGPKFGDFVQLGKSESTIKMVADNNGEKLKFDIKLNSKGGCERDLEYQGKHYKNSEVTPILESLDLPFYSTIIFSMQGDKDVASMTPSQRADFLQRLLQFDFSSQSAKLKDKVDELTDNIKYNDSQLQFLEESLKTKVEKPLNPLPYTEEIIADYKNLSAKLGEDLKKRDSVIEEKSKIQKEISDIENEINLCRVKDEAKKTTAKLLNDKKAKLAEEIEQANKIVVPEEVDYTAETADLKKKIDDLKAESKTNNSNFISYQSSLVSLQERERLHKAGKCPTCGTPTDFIANENNEEKIAQVTRSISISKARDEEIDKEINELQDKVNLATSNSNSQKVKIESAKQLKAQAEKRIESIKAEIDNTTIDVSDYQLIIDLKTKEKTEKSENLTKLQAIYDSFAETEKQKKVYDDAIASFNDIFLKNSWIETENKKVRDDIVATNKKIDEIKALNVQYSQQQGYYKEARKVLDTDLPNYLIVKTCARIEQEMNSIIKIVFPTMDLKLFQSKKGVEFYYKKDNPADTSKKENLLNAVMASGFESQLLSVAFKVALCKAYNLSFAILDEVDAFASDSSSEKIFTSLIDSKVFDQMFIITHKASTREVIKAIAPNCSAYHVEKGVFIPEV